MPCENMKQANILYMPMLFDLPEYHSQCYSDREKAE